MASVPKITIPLGCQSGKFKSQIDSKSGKFGAKCRIWIWGYVENHGAYVKISVKSGKSTFKVRSESGKLSTIGCHLPPKSTHFGTLVMACWRNLMSKSLKMSNQLQALFISVGQTAGRRSKIGSPPNDPNMDRSGRRDDHIRRCDPKLDRFWWLLPSDSL